MEGKQLPAEMHINISLLALVESNFISVVKFENGLVWGPVLDSSVFSTSSLQFVLSQELLVIEGVEIGSLSLVGELRGVAEHISVEVIPAVVEIAIHCALIVHLVYEHVVLALVSLKVG